MDVTDSVLYHMLYVMEWLYNFDIRMEFAATDYDIFSAAYQ